ncbi:hypothetical protein PoB_006239200 [Plakobranchus ocellatus]|uniref:Reverse transcriptase/retrotransposon-derived protein RNase H-like domain-containing protein n=1 Tax=Plakobranchus ocellatus TaxID=259542 RepID=A0AAV4CVE5_9GAST|nr:hypothetical protein PoB_006239200 [Plakobranchus ocellatus]
MAVTCRPVPHLPDIDSKFVLRTNASDLGLGVALMQRGQDQFLYTHRSAILYIRGSELRRQTELSQKRFCNIIKET